MASIYKTAPYAIIKESIFKNSTTVRQNPFTKMKDAVDTFTSAKSLTPTHTVTHRVKYANGRLSHCEIEPCNFVYKIKRFFANKFRFI